MNTKLLMTASALLAGLAGIIFTFLPDKLIRFVISPETDAITSIFFQLAGALYFGFAMVNWTAHASLIGGIYSRPVAMGNFAHFMIGSFSLGKGFFSTGETAILLAAIVYSLFAILFGWVLLRYSPVKSPTV